MAEHMTAEQVRARLTVVADGLREARGYMPTDDRTIESAIHILRDLAARLSGMAADRKELTDAQIVDIAVATRSAEPGRDGYILPVKFARAVLAAAAPEPPHV